MAALQGRSRLCLGPCLGLFSPLAYLAGFLAGSPRRLLAGTTVFVYRRLLAEAVALCTAGILPVVSERKEPPRWRRYPPHPLPPVLRIVITIKDLHARASVSMIIYLTKVRQHAMILPCKARLTSS